MTNHKDQSVFPDPVYKRTVLEPLFEGSKKHFSNCLMEINRAHAVMLVETGIIESDVGVSLLDALDRIERELDVNALTYTGEVEDFFFQIEAELITILGVDIAGRLHTGRSRNDIDHTVFKMKLRDHLDCTLENLGLLIEALLQVADAGRETIIVAYTHGQPAQPSTYGHYLAAFMEGLLRDADRLVAARKNVDLCSMGAAAITTTGFAIDRHRMADLLGFRQPQENAYGCIASVDYITETYSALRLCMLHVGRFMQDMQYWTGHEVGQLYIPNAFVQISSIMPQKRNPVPIEHIRLKASLAAGRADAQIMTVHNTPFTDMNDSEGEVQESGYLAFATANDVFELLAALIRDVKINEGRVAEILATSCITITELADSLVREENLSFREAHEIAAHVAQHVTSKRGTLGADGFEVFVSAFETATGRKTAIDQKAFARFVSAEHFIGVRDRFGGPAPVALAKSLNRIRKCNEDLFSGIQNNRNGLKKSGQDLIVAINKIQTGGH